MDECSLAYEGTYNMHGLGARVLSSILPIQEEKPCGQHPFLRTIFTAE